MRIERNIRVAAPASAAVHVAAVLATAALVAMLADCQGAASTAPTRGNTGPGATVGRVSVISGATSAAVGDSLYYMAKAYDNAGNELPVTFYWHSVNYDVVDIDPATGHGKALKAGQTQIYASVGSAVSDYRTVIVH